MDTQRVVIKTDLQSLNFSFTKLRSTLTGAFLFLGSLIYGPQLDAMPGGKTISSNDYREVVMLELVNPDTKITTTCTGVVISSSQVITTASCVYYKEALKLADGAKVCIGARRPFQGKDDGCFRASQIFIHHEYVSRLADPGAVNLAYLQMDKPLDLKALNIRPAKLLPPELFSRVASRGMLNNLSWVGFDSTSLTTSSRGVKRSVTLNSAEYDFVRKTVSLSSDSLRTGRQYQGVATYYEHSGERYLLGMVSRSEPDNLISFYPEINPCEEDPVIVKYPKPIIFAETEITLYPVAACGMPGFFKSEGYDIGSCKRFIDAELAVERQVRLNQVQAARQLAKEKLLKQDSQADASDILRQLFKAEQAGDEQASLLLAKIQYEGELMPQNLEGARKRLEKLESTQYPEVAWLLSRIMLDQTDEAGSELKKTIFDLTQQAAERGLPDAQYQLARYYQTAYGVERSERKAYDWHARAAQQGQVDAQFQLATHLSDGRGVRPHYEASRFWLTQAAGQGHLEAQNYLGLLKPIAGN